MLINKLNYLVFKDISITENGGLLKGYQLTYIPEKLKNVGHQCGCIFYVPAAYTSKIDPTTGFVNIFKFKDLTVDAKREFIKKFDSIRYDSEKNCFVLHLIIITLLRKILLCQSQAGVYIRTELG